MKTGLRVLFSALFMLAGGATAQAQYYRAQPPVSPYLNLLRGGASVSSNYFNLVQPENEFRSSILKLQQQTGANQTAITDLQFSGGKLATGHLSGFQTQASYFQTMSGGAIGSRAGGGGTSKSSKATGK